MNVTDEAQREFPAAGTQQGGRERNGFADSQSRESSGAGVTLPLGQGWEAKVRSLFPKGRVRPQGLRKPPSGDLSHQPSAVWVGVNLLILQMGKLRLDPTHPLEGAQASAFTTWEDMSCLFWGRSL